jgi:membrane protein
MFAAFTLPLSWGELFKRTAKDASEDDVLGLAAQLSYYLFLALFPAILFLLALASLLPVTDYIDEVIAALRPIAPAEMLSFLDEQLRRVANSDSGGLLTLGVLGALWSSSAAIVAIVGSLNRAYDIEEARPWWKVRLVALGLTVGVSLLVLVSFALIIAGPRVAEYLAATTGLGGVFEWTWKILQWPLVFFLVSTALGLIYYFAPDADQDWVWITPGAVIGTALWIAVSLGFKFYVANFTDYNATYGAVGSVIVLLLWFYVSGLAILVGAELNAEIEHASPYGKAPGEKVPGQRKKIGVAAARAYKERLSRTSSAAGPASTAAPGRAADASVVSVLSGGVESMTMHTEDRSLGQLFGELSRDTRTLVQQEIRLAKAEVAEKAGIMARGVGFVVGGGFVAYGGLLALIATLILGLVALGLPPWAAALIGGVLAIAGGYVLIRAGLAALKPSELTPKETIATLKENAQWLGTQTR